MKWINEPIRGTAGYTEQMLALTPVEARIIAEALCPTLKALQKKYNHLENIRQSGEATEKQLDKWLTLQERVETIECFIIYEEDFS